MIFQRFLKRQIDFWGALFLLILLAVPFLVISIFITLDSKGPVFYVRDRVGKDGKVFRMIKFRTMDENAEQMGRGIELEKDDSRITKIGKWLRRCRIDESPQLLHVLTGTMSLVGPRPGLPHQVMQYTELERKRLVFKPGMASMDMIKGGNILSWKERIQWDIWYIDHWSLWLDLRIIFGTFFFILSGKDEYGKGIVEDYK